jgi:hypothetical protein
MTVDDLSNESCIEVFAKVGQKYVGNAGYDAPTASALLRAVVAPDLPQPPPWLDHPESPGTFGPIARRLLKEMLDSEDQRLRKLVNAAIAEQATKKGQIVDLAVLALGGGILLSLAIISKIKRTKDKGWEIEPGFPGLAEVLEKAGKLLDKLQSATSKPGSN